MRINKIGLIFLSTLALLFLLIGFKTGFFIKYKPEATRILALFFQNKSTNHKEVQKTTLKIENVLRERLAALETPPSEITVLHLLENSTIEIKATVPKGKPMEWIIWYLCSSAPTAGYFTEDCYYQENPFKCLIKLKSKEKGLPSVKMTLFPSKKYFSTTAKMAIIISDFSFQATTATVDYLSFPEPITISMASSKKMAASTAQIAHEHHKEIILLLPMEPLTKSYASFQNEAILLHYSQEKIHSIIEKATAVIPFYTGFSNAGGARVLDDSRVMKMVLSEIKERNSYFLIDGASRRSAAATLARELNVPHRTIEISLDSSASSKESVADTLHHAAMIAQKTGSVIISGRATSQYIKAIKEQLPYFQHNGIQLVPVSDLVHQF
jgi:hypothetical protein